MLRGNGKTSKLVSETDDAIDLSTSDAARSVTAPPKGKKKRSSFPRRTRKRRKKQALRRPPPPLPQTITKSCFKSYAAVWKAWEESFS